MLESSAPCRYFNSSPEVIHLVVMMYARYPLSLRNVEDLLAERGINISHETIRFWCNRFGPMFARKSFARRSDSTSGSRLAFVTSRICSRSAELQCRTKQSDAG
jgi:putative transposase